MVYAVYILFFSTSFTLGGYVISPLFTFAQGVILFKSHQGLNPINMFIYVSITLSVIIVVQSYVNLKEKIELFISRKMQSEQVGQLEEILNQFDDGIIIVKEKAECTNQLKYSNKKVSLIYDQDFD
jgi:exonuclease VII small subunit